MKQFHRATLALFLTSSVVLVVACSSDDGTSGTSGASEAGSSGGAPKPNGAACTEADECQSSFCQAQGTGGGDGGAAASGSFCTVACTMKGQNGDPACAAPIYTGRCSGQGFCQIK